MSALLRGPGNGVSLQELRDLRYVKTTLGNGYLGSRIDEERSEMRYLV
jgi:trehalose/maltose hydrolase-like predicted phosphorylase